MERLRRGASRAIIRPSCPPPTQPMVRVVGVGGRRLVMILFLLIAVDGSVMCGRWLGICNDVRATKNQNGGKQYPQDPRRHSCVIFPSRKYKTSVRRHQDLIPVI